MLGSGNISAKGLFYLLFCGSLKYMLLGEGVTPKSIRISCERTLIDKHTSTCLSRYEAQ